MTSSHARSLTAVLVAAILALMAAACGGPGSSNRGSAASGLASTSFDTSKKVTITMWDTENSPGPSKALNELISQFEQKYPNVTVDRTVKLRRLHGHHQARRLVRQRARRLPGQRGIGRPGAGEGAPDRAARLAGEGLRLGQPIRQLGRAEPAALVGRWPALGHRRYVGGRPEGGGAGSLLQQGHHEAARHEGADHVAEFEQSLATAKAGGVPPIMVGNLDRWPMGHVFMVLQSRFDDPTGSPTGRTAGRAPPSTTPAPARQPRSSSSGAPRGISRTASTASARPLPPPASARARGSTSSPAPGRTRPLPAP